MFLLNIIFAVSFFANAGELGVVEVFDHDTLKNSKSCYSEDVFSTTFCIFPITIICENKVVAQTPSCNHAFYFHRIFSEHNKARATVKEYMKQFGFEADQVIYNRGQFITFLK